MLYACTRRNWTGPLDSSQAELSERPDWKLNRRRGGREIKKYQEDLSEQWLKKVEVEEKIAISFHVSFWGLKIVFCFLVWVCFFFPVVTERTQSMGDMRFRNGTGTKHLFCDENLSAEKPGCTLEKEVARVWKVPKSYSHWEREQQFLGWDFYKSVHPFIGKYIFCVAVNQAETGSAYANLGTILSPACCWVSSGFPSSYLF